MRKARDILRLKHEMGLGVRQIARNLRISHGTVVNYLGRAEAAQIRWPLPEGINDKQVQQLLSSSQKPPEQASRALPDMAELHKEREFGVTSSLLIALKNLQAVRGLLEVSAYLTFGAFVAS